MIQQEQIHLFEAIGQMRKLTAQGKYFTFVHATYNRDTMTSDGVRVVHRARLRPAAKKDDVINSDHKIFYYDMDRQMPRNCWQVLIMFFQGKKVVL